MSIMDTFHCRYKLQQPKPSYKHYFSTIQRKFEVCTGIYDLMAADKKVSYADVVAHVRLAPPSLCLPRHPSPPTPSASNTSGITDARSLRHNGGLRR